ncbi:MAG TPA: tRNA epoxyqueuosine(34) reductase QueG [Polyangiaceae bacterium]|nr:tRNA epoxyqueuosine(34) reductase QueG [Polyangiaceae bacterium]
MGDFDELVRERARALGFAHIGVASAAHSLEPDFGRYEAFVDAGMHGTMAYLAEAREARRRIDRDSILEGARSIVCVAESYAGVDPTANDEGIVQHIARYARGGDYHNHLRRRVRKLAAFIRTLGEGTRARPMTDDAPLLERAWAARAGLGFVGKNGLLIVPGLGSFVLLGEVVTTLELAPQAPMAERCGSCTLCLESCPTQAFDRAFVLDPRRCISYLTIELRGAMPAEQRLGVGEHLFGCDACQDVCPYNRARHGDVPSRYLPLERWRELSLEGLVDLDEERYRTLTEGSPLKRATRQGLARNAITILAGRRQMRYRALFERVARDHHDAVVREHAAWGLELLGPENPAK